jgi:hypothetical protein
MDIRYFAYVSLSKIVQLYDQISDLSDTTEKVQTIKGTTGGVKATGGLKGLLSGEVQGSLKQEGLREVTGKRSDIQKLQVLLQYIDEHQHIDDLNDLCAKGAGAKLEAFAYSYRGEFRVGRSEGWRSDEGRPPRDQVVEDSLEEVADRENRRFPAPNGLRTPVSGVVILESRCHNYTIDLACSLKYFTDMGASARGDDIEYHPHSGNYHFFEGETTAFLEGLIFVTTVRRRTIVGSPLFLNYYTQEGLAL